MNVFILYLKYKWQAIAIRLEASQLGWFIVELRIRLRTHMRNGAISYRLKQNGLNSEEISIVRSRFWNMRSYRIEQNIKRLQRINMQRIRITDIANNVGFGRCKIREIIEKETGVDI